MSKKFQYKDVPISSALQALLDNTPPVEEVLADLAREPLNLDQDPEHIASQLKSDIVEYVLIGMREAGINQNQLAERLGKSRQWVSRLLNEGDNFTVATIAKLACALGKRPFIHFAGNDETVKVMPRQRAKASASTRKKTQKKETSVSSELSA